MQINWRCRVFCWNCKIKRFIYLNETASLSCVNKNIKNTQKYNLKGYIRFFQSRVLLSRVITVLSLLRVKSWSETKSIAVLTLINLHLCSIQVQFNRDAFKNLQDSRCDNIPRAKAFSTLKTGNQQLWNCMV